MMIFSKSFNRLTITPKYTTQRTFRVPTSGSSSSQYLFSCKRVVLSRNFTDAVTDQKKHFEQLAQKLGVEKPEAWFKLKQADVQKHGGELLKQYGSLLSALPSVFPELNNVWKDKRNHRQYFEALKPQLGVKSPDDWYTLDANAIMAVIDPALLTQYYQGSFLRALEDAYPEVTFAEDKFQTSVRDLVLQAPKKRKESAAPATPKPLSEAALARKAALERVSLPSNPSGINYTVRRGKSRGVPTCRGCKRAFEDKSELRIQTTLLYEAPGLDPRPVTVNFCINQACLSTALKNYKKKDSVIHPFNGKVEVPSDIPKSELPTDAEGIVFVQTDTPSTPATTTAAATN